MAQLAELLARWDANEGKPYKGLLIDMAAYEKGEGRCAMCAQGQVLHLLAGWSPAQLRDTDQDEADRAVAGRLNISIAHSILLRSINDNADGAPSIVLTHPEKILGDQAQTVLAFWLHLDRMEPGDSAAAGDAAGADAVDAAVDAAVAAARDAATGAARAAAWVAAWAAARAAAGAAARAAAGAAATGAARVAAGAAAGAAAENACSEIQGARILREQGKSFFFLPMFGFADPESISPLPADYGQVSA